MADALYIDSRAQRFGLFKNKIEPPRPEIDVTWDSSSQNLNTYCIEFLRHIYTIHMYLVFRALSSDFGFKVS